jgi:hypothetical protein
MRDYLRNDVLRLLGVSLDWNHLPFGVDTLVKEGIPFHFKFGDRELY